MTLHALRLQIGDAAFFRLLQASGSGPTAGGNVAIPQFIALAERISGRELDAFFNAWLFTPSKPPGIEPQARGARRRHRRARREADGGASDGAGT